MIAAQAANHDRMNSAERIASAAAFCWTLLFALHTVGGVMALSAARAPAHRGWLLFETVPMLVLVALAAVMWFRRCGRGVLCHAPVAIAWIALPPIVDYALWQPIARGLFATFTQGDVALLCP